MGIRKIIGGRRRSIFFQFLLESVVLSVLALVAAAIFMESFILPQFKKLVIFDALNFKLENDWLTYLFFLLFAVIAGSIAGILPAIYLSGFQPIKVLSNVQSLKVFSRLHWRKLLIVVQFVITILFFITSIILYQQTNYMLHAEYGFEQENILNLTLKNGDLETLKTRLKQNPEVIEVGGVSILPGVGGRVTDLILEEGKEDAVFDKLHVDEAFLELLDIKLLAGRNFEKNDPPGKSQVLINKEAVQRMGWGDPERAIGQTLHIGQPEGIIPATVIGVIDNIYSHLIIQKPEPLFLSYEPTQLGIANIKISGKNIPETITFLEKTWSELYPEKSIEYEFYEDRLNQNLSPLTSGVSVIGFLTLITIIIMSLGLLGIASYTVEVRKKEIGIRKVMGADTKRILWTLSRSLVQMIFIAVLIGLPLTWFLNHLWLQNLPERVPLNFMNIGLGAISLLSLAFLIVFSQSYRIAQHDPVEVLRSE